MRACEDSAPMAMKFGSILMWHDVMVTFLLRRADRADGHRGSKNRGEQGSMLAKFGTLGRLTCRLAISQLHF